MKRKKRKKISYQRTIVIGFAAIYLTCMLLTTYLMKEKYEETFINQASEDLQDVENSILESALFQYDEDGNLSQDFIEEMQCELSSYFSYNGNKYMLVCTGVYGPDGTLIARTLDNYGFAGYVYGAEGAERFALTKLEDYFNEDELEEIRYYYEAASKAEMQNKSESYGLSVIEDFDTDELVNLSIYKTKINNVVEEGNSLSISSRQDVYDYQEKVFSWQNPDKKAYKHYDQSYGKMNYTLTDRIYFPYLKYGRAYYDKWKNDDYLQTFDLIQETTDHIEYFQPLEQRERNTYTYVAPLRFPDFDTTNDKYTIQMNLRIDPWRAAADYLKYIYIYGFILMLVCMAKVLYSTGKAYKMQAELEETRRDFTNAIAHELKTPLSVIRGLAENLEEEQQEEMRNYYTNQIVNQTEVMDSMVGEMILISKLDSDKLVLKENSIDVLQIIEEQFEKLEPFIKEKKLKIQYWKEGDFILNGDKNYLEKAVLNLLENAVYYNMEGGSIVVTVNEKQCMIENTANPIPEEDLPHVCDMFFTGNKSRTSGVKHMGLGLYLAKKIFTLHEMEFAVSNTEVGVKVEFGRLR